MTENQREKWEKTRAKGRAHFIWVRGVLAWGGLTAIFWSAFMGFVIGDAAPLSFLVVAIAIFPIGGYFWGIWVWEIGERKYLEATEDNSLKDRVQGLEQEVADLKKERQQTDAQDNELGA